MDVVGIVIAADGVHIGVDALAGVVAVTVECHALPLGKGLHDLGFLVADLLDGEFHLALHAVQIVVDAAALLHDKRCGHTVKGQCEAQRLLEQILDILDRVLGFAQCQRGRIILRKIQRF